MAFITSETVKKIRESLKKEFPEIKFSITKHHHSEIQVAIMKSPYFEDGEEHSGMQYHTEQNYTEEQCRVINKINEIIRTDGEYFDKSDPMTDYFYTAFYYDIIVGKWDKPHVKTKK